MLDEVQNYLNQRMMFADELAMPLVCALGTHLTQLQQSENEFYFLSGRPARLNLSAMALGPSGCSKSFSMAQVLDMAQVPNSRLQTITAAGLIGSKDQEGNKVSGLAKTLSNGILVVGEMSTLVSSNQREDSIQLLNCIMEMLSEGKVGKRLSTVHFQYPTNMNLWGGVQLSSKRFDFTGGLARRCIFIFKRWTMKDINKLKMSRIKYKNVGPDIDFVAKVKNYIDTRKVHEVDIKEKDERWFARNGMTLNDVTKLEEAAIGYSYWNRENESDYCIKVRLDSKMKKRLKTMKKMWEDIARGPEAVLAECVMGKNGIEMKKFNQIFLSYGYTETHVADLVYRLKRAGLIKQIDDKYKPSHHSIDKFEVYKKRR